MRTNKRYALTLSFILTLFAVAFTATGCGNDEPKVVVRHAPPQEVTVQEVAQEASEGLDLEAVGALVAQVQNAEELEKKLNDPDLGMNNLDLNGNGEIDYISVSEYNDNGAFVYSLNTFPEPGQEQNIANITVEQVSGSQSANVQVSGNEQVYGEGHHYHSHMSFGDALFLAWVFRPYRPLWIAPWGYGGYYGGWGARPIMSRTAYRSRVGNVRSSSRSTFNRSNTSTLKRQVSSPKAKASASSGIKSQLAKPTNAQKQWSARPENKPVGRGGFGQNRQQNVQQGRQQQTKQQPAKTSPSPGRTNRQQSSRSSSTSRSSGGK